MTLFHEHVYDMLKASTGVAKVTILVVVLLNELKPGLMS
jgi:hypothetical protein